MSGKFVKIPVEEALKNSTVYKVLKEQTKEIEKRRAQENKQ
jgi:hypothetical protein